MQLTLQDRMVTISFEPIERLWGCHLGDRIEFPLTELQQVSAQRPPSHWRELRAPGTYWPGLIKAGTYYSELGRAFWYVQREQDCICLDLSEKSYYKRIVLASPQAGEWITQIQSALAN